jgi:hypothetical protein
LKEKKQGFSRTIKLNSFHIAFAKALRFFYSAKADSFFDFYPLAQASGNLLSIKML